MSIAHSIARRRRTSCPCEETVDDSLPRRRRHTCERAGDGWTGGFMGRSKLTTVSSGRVAALTKNMHYDICNGDEFNNLI